MADPGARSGQRWRVVAVAGLMVWPGGGLAATAQTGSTMTRAAFQGQVQAAEATVAACATAAAGCSESSVPANGQVAAERGQPAFAADWDWLRDAVHAARDAKAAKRVEEMRAAAARLAELDEEVASTQGTAPARDAEGRAQRAAAQVLAGAEFAGANTQPSWYERLLARVQDWLFRLLSGMGRAGSRHPWLAPVIEWGCFALAAAGLMFFVLRNLRRQSLRIALGGELAAAQRSEHGTADWARMAAERAAQGNWREGVHSLYWAAIASLEDRRAWKPNPTRTPREYLPLLRVGSEAQTALRELTRSLERFWYGRAEANEADFRAAETAYRRVVEANLRSSEGAPNETALPRSPHGAAGVA